MKRLTVKEILALDRMNLKSLSADAVIAIAKLLENYHEQKQKEDSRASAIGPEKDCSLHGTACHGAWCATREGVAQ